MTKFDAQERRAKILVSPIDEAPILLLGTDSFEVVITRADRTSHQSIRRPYISHHHHHASKTSRQQTSTKKSAVALLFIHSIAPLYFNYTPQDSTDTKMGRYSSVQAYADNNKNVRSISYDQATGGGSAGGEGGAKKVVTEKVSNPYGSTAGAGSGEFHVYRHARAREASRWEELDQAEQQKEKELEFQMQLQKNEEESSKRTEKNRRKRQREKEAKLRKKSLKAAGISLETSNNSVSCVDKSGDEFEYVPEKDKAIKDDKGIVENQGHTEGGVEASAVSLPPLEVIPNDGSFLGVMKKKLEQEQASKYGGLVEDDEEGPMLPPPAKKLAIESRIIDDDDEEGPVPFR